MKLWSNDNSHTSLVGMENCTVIWETVWPFLIKANIHLLFTQQSTSKYLSKGTENLCLYKDLNANVPAAVSVRAPNWKQPKSPPTGELVNK